MLKNQYEDVHKTRFYNIYVAIKSANDIGKDFPKKEKCFD